MIEGGAGNDSVKFVLAGTVDATSSQRPALSGIETLTALGSAGADRLTVTAAQFARFSEINLAAGSDTVTVVVSGVADFTSGLPALSGVEAVNLVGAGSVRLNVAQLGTFSSIAPGLVVTLADTGANLAALTPAAFAQLAARGIDRLDATDGLLSLSIAELQALGPVALTAGDQVVLLDYSTRIQALTPAQIAEMAARGVDAIDASNDTLTLGLDQFKALGKIALTATDAVTLADTGANLAALTPAAFAQLAARGIDRLDATDGLLSLSVAELQALGPVALTAFDQVVLHDASVRIQALTPAQIAEMAAMGVDAIDASNGTLTLGLAQFNALGKIALTATDAVTLAGTAGDDVLSFARQTLGAEDKIDGGAGYDKLVLAGDYGTGLTLNSGTLTNVESLILRKGFDYDFTLSDANVGAGQVLTVSARDLGASDSFVFDGSQETDGSFKLLGGGAASTNFTGGSKADLVVAGTGIDTIAYTDANQSTSLNYDTVKGFDFATDLLDVAGAITSVATVNSGKLGVLNFDNNLATAMNGVLDAHTAALFTPTTFALQGATFLVVDQNGLAGYQSGDDLVLRLDNATNLNAFGVDLFV
jgi:hypothetical protein